VGDLFYNVAMIFLRVAILHQWMRIFYPRGARDVFYWALMVLMWMNVLFYISCIGVQMFRCTPIRKAWDPLVEGGHCVTSFDTMDIMTPVFNAMSDLAVLFLAQRVIWRLQMGRRRKIGISIVFAFGIL
jgi:hypothetical protein